MSSKDQLKAENKREYMACLITNATEADGANQLCLHTDWNICPHQPQIMVHFVQTYGWQNNSWRLHFLINHSVNYHKTNYLRNANPTQTEK